MLLYFGVAEEYAVQNLTIYIYSIILYIILTNNNSNQQIHIKQL